jgi:hypothetical protein
MTKAFSHELLLNHTESVRGMVELTTPYFSDSPTVDFPTKEVCSRPCINPGNI